MAGLTLSESRNEVTGVILSGGRGRRMAGEDKGLMEWAGKPLISWTLDRLSRQAGKILIVANRNIARYKAFGYPVISDSIPGYLGPLAGILSAMQVAQTRYILCVPCDGPKLPLDLLQRLWAESANREPRAACVYDGQRIQPLYNLLDVGLIASINDELKAGNRALEYWMLKQDPVLVDYSKQGECFTNINTKQELDNVKF
ncbi:MAG: molybdenum cofactor guanylyltransferase [Gammaproteobacteria bacterium]|nr:MAG: molybdenum cofactor guanylyltransferase [Gammaproteobacteria bacterium]